MKVEFSREEIVTRSYSMSLSQFMLHYFREYQLDKWNGITYLNICINSGLSKGYLCLIYKIPLNSKEEGLDFDDKKNVKSVLKRYLKEQQDEKDSFSL